MVGVPRGIILSRNRGPVNYILATLTGLCWVSAALLGRAAEPLAEERASDRFPVIESPSVGLPAGKEITLKGMVLNNAHTGQDQKGVFVDVLDGPPEIRAQVEKIMAECYPENGLDADAAMKLHDAWSQRLKYFIASPLAGELHKQATYNARQAMAVTGVVEEKDGQKWIAVSKCEPTAFIPGQDAGAGPVIHEAGPEAVNAADQRRRGPEVHLGAAWQILYERAVLPMPSLARGSSAPGRTDQGLLHGGAPDHLGNLRRDHGHQAQRGQSGQGACQPLLHRYVQVLRDVVGENRAPGAHPHSRRVGIRGPGGHVQPDIPGAVRGSGQQCREAHACQIKAAERLGLLRHVQQRVGTRERRVQCARPPGHGGSAPHSG